MDGVGEPVRCDPPFEDHAVFIDLMASTVSQRRDQYLLINPTFIRKPIPRVIGGMIDAGDLNAMAFRDRQGIYYVGINAGIFNVINFLFHRLLCSPTVLGWVEPGTSVDESLVSGLPPLPTNISLLAARYLSHEESRVRLSPIRDEAATMMSSEAINMVMDHEFRHIMGGHLDYSSSFGATFAFQEAMRLADDDERGLTEQAIEMDADEYAIREVLMNLLTYHRGNHPSGLDYGKFFEKPEHVIESSLLCIDTLFALFDMGSFQNVEDWSRLDHPPAHIRRKMIFDRMLEFISLEPILATVREPQLEEIKSRVAAITDGITYPIFGKQPPAATIVNVEELSNRHIQKIRQKWSTIAESMSKHRFADMGLDVLRETRL